MCFSRFSFADDFVLSSSGWEGLSVEGVGEKICFLLPHSRIHLQVKMGFLLHVRPDVEASIEADKSSARIYFSANESTFCCFSWWCLKLCNVPFLVPRFSLPNLYRIAQIWTPSNILADHQFFIFPRRIPSFLYSYICFINQTFYTSWRFSDKCVFVW